MRIRLYFILSLVFISCSSNDNSISNSVGGQNTIAKGCDNVHYPNWSTSLHVLPYPVGQSYTIGLSNCSGGTLHSEGMPDQFAIDFNMSIGSVVTAVRKGTIMFVEESGMDYEFPNNFVVLRDEDGYFFQYRHLTHNGAFVEQGQFVEKGDSIGLSGASGDARYPHLHLVATGINWQFSYTSFPVTFKNTTENSNSLIQGQTYLALPYN